MNGIIDNLLFRIQEYFYELIALVHCILKFRYEYLQSSNKFDTESRETIGISGKISKRVGEQETWRKDVGRVEKAGV